MVASWATHEADQTTLPDRRLQARLATVLTELGQDPERSLPAACRSWAETLTAYRFFDNPRGVLRPHSGRPSASNRGPDKARGDGADGARHDNFDL